MNKGGKFMPTKELNHNHIYRKKRDNAGFLNADKNYV